MLKKVMLSVVMVGMVYSARSQVGPLRPVNKGETDQPCVCFVNVSNACDRSLLQKTVMEFLPGIVYANFKVAEANTFGGEARFDIRNPDQRFGKTAKIIVYVVNDSALPHLMCVPGYWALVNVRGLEKGAGPEKYERRIRQMMLKGLALSVGVGANMDSGRCVMSQGSFDTLQGIDGTSTSYSPYAVGPIMDILQAKGLLKPVVFTEE